MSFEEGDCISYIDPKERTEVTDTIIKADSDSYLISYGFLNNHTICVDSEVAGQTWHRIRRSFANSVFKKETFEKGGI